MLNKASPHKSVWGNEDVAPHNRSFGIRWKRVTARLRSLYFRGKSPLHPLNRDCLRLRASAEVVGERGNTAPFGKSTQAVQTVVLSDLHWLLKIR
jgi:hypothetical protein